MRKVFDQVDVEHLYAVCESLTLEQNPKFMMGATQCEMHRAVGFFADDNISGYKYARQESKSQPLPIEMRRVLAFVNKLCGAHFNGVLVNKYAYDSSINAHSDNERELVPDVGVVAINIGATRTMRFKHVLTRQQKADLKARRERQPFHEVELVGGTIMVMHGAEFQKRYTHEIRALKAAPAAGPRFRYSWTFRQHAIKK